LKLQALLPAGPHPLARRAALTVHALGRTDRVWLLAQLPAVERERLESMLEELAALGIPVDRGVLDEVVSSAPAEPAAPLAARVDTLPHKPVDFAQQQAALSRVDPAVLVKLLHKEPAGLIARVLASHAWPWRQAVLEQLGPAKRRHIEELLDRLRRQVQPRAPESLHKALVEAVYSRLADFAKLSGQDEEAAAGLHGGASPHTSRWIATLPEWLRPWLGRRK
jgi:hypothetical protein